VGCGSLQAFVGHSTSPAFEEAYAWI